MQTEKIGLVTVLYNSNIVLEGFIKSISTQDYKNYILYLVDNSYNDNTNKILEQLLNKYKVNAYKHINASSNIGVAAGNNIGIKEALSDLCTDVILLNNDIEFESEDVFSKILLIAKEKKIDIVVPKILYFDDRKVWMAGGYMDNLRALGVHYTESNTRNINKSQNITYAPTCFMLIKASVFSTIGDMDEKYFAYCDDTDFVFRAIKNKMNLFYESSITILHKVSSSSGGDNSLFYIYYSNRNKLYFIRKNYFGIRKWFAIMYTLTSRVLFYIKFNKEQRIKLIDALKDGFKL